MRDVTDVFLAIFESGPDAATTAELRECIEYLRLQLENRRASLRRAPAAPAPENAQ